jgi:hypothetical protein
VPTLELGGGMQWLVWNGLGVGFDASLMGSLECFSCGVVGLGSFDVTYHFIRPSRRLVPFVLAGVGVIASTEGADAPLANLGGGVNYWFDSGVALRLELRDRFDTGGTHHVEARIGVTF